MNDSGQVTALQVLSMESEILSVLDHPHIVQYLGFEELATNFSLFFEYVPGGSIGSVLQKVGRFHNVVVRLFTWQILDGLEYLHSQGISHGDLRSDKVLVEMTGVCKIAGFGASKQMDDTETGDCHYTKQGNLFWMAPERINTRMGACGPKGDVWSVGCVALEMWGSTRPWPGEEMVAVMFKLYRAEVPLLLESMDLSAYATDFRLRCFTVNPDQRPSASQLKEHPYLKVPHNWSFTGFTTSNYF